MIFVSYTYLLGLHASEAEHADLICDMLPVVRGSLSGQTILELLPHGNNAVSHTLHITQPLLSESRVREDLSDDASTVHRGVGLHRADENLDLRHDTSSLVLILLIKK